MELEALKAIDSEVRELGARIVTVTPETERYTRDVHKKLNVTFGHGCVVTCCYPNAHTTL